MQSWNWVKRYKGWIVSVIFIIGAITLLVYKPGWTGFGADSITNTERDSSNRLSKTIEIEQSGKTLWDWMSVLGVPLSLAILGFWFQNREQKRTEQDAKLERELATANQREEVLQSYFDRISILLIDKQLIALVAKNENRELTEAAVDVIRARTLSILRQFSEDGERKGSVVRFLVESDVIKKLRLDLRDANLHSTNLGRIVLESASLTNANLTNANISFTNLVGAKLAGAIFHGANLSNVSLVDANLRGANFSDCVLRSVDFYKATLNNVNFNGTILLNSELNKSKGLDLVQFTGTNPPLLCATSLPSNIKHLSGDRDCDRLPEVLKKKYPDRFETLEKAKQYVESAQKTRQNSRRV